MASIELDETRYHYALLQDALLIIRSGVGDIQQARADYHKAREWLDRNEAIGKLLDYIDQKDNDHE